MSAFLESGVISDISPVHCSINYKQVLNNNKPRHIFKSKENIKPKCSKELKKKLKKYKLRRDGQEDQEVLDVSQILITALNIKSPNKQEENLNGSEEEIRPRNYLSKMGRRKKVLGKIETGDNVFISNITQDQKTIDKHDHGLVFSKTLKVEIQNNLKENDLSDKEKDKPQANAFKLLMDSRNKSIGSNSPGKEKVIAESKIYDKSERKNIKAKRTLILQKMAEAKGSLKKKEIEEYQEHCIKKKMAKRAERLKSSILKPESKTGKKDVKQDSINKKHKDRVITVEKSYNQDIKIVGNENKLTLVDLFEDTSKAINTSLEIKKVAKEDVEFLKKLSPSMKKKENMLCYFKKVDKEQDDSIVQEDSIIECSNVNGESENNIIKVKLTKIKKRVKKRKLSLKKEAHDQESIELDISEHYIGIEKKIQNREKRVPVDGKVLRKSDEVLDISRPKRNVKRPAKYTDEFALTSSDEELHIFTPKKKKHVINDPDLKLKGDSEMVSQKINVVENIKNKRNSKILRKKDKITTDRQQKKTLKLAPIFLAKPQMNAAAIEAKQRFLSSGVPDKLRKNIEKQSNLNVGTNNFTPVVHIQQQDQSILNAANKIIFKYREDEYDENSINETDFIKNIIDSSQSQNNYHKDVNLLPYKIKVSSVLHKIKQMCPEFPVYRTYRLLKDKSKGEFKDCSYLDLDNSIEVINGMIDLNNDSPDKINWTDKYKPMTSKQIIGNFETTKELKKWLVTWTENEVKLKKHNSQSDSSDFYHSDTDSKDSIRSSNNLLIITGPVGSGKTSIVYAVAAELAIKVLEVNASSKRTGKIMLQDLQEATRSHKVNRGKNSQDIQKSQDIQVVIDMDEPKKLKKRGRQKRVIEITTKKPETLNEVLRTENPSSQENARHCMSLILIDDADIVFEQDDGFCSAIVQLAQCSKRPVILVTSSTTCPHLQRFFQTAKIIHTHSLSPGVLGTWLDLLCLTEYGACWPGIGARILDYFKGDIRKTINFLQFHLLKENSSDETRSQNIDCYRLNIEDENSNMSWFEREGLDEKFEYPTSAKDDVWHCFVKADLHHFDTSIKLFDIWWNIPRLLYKMTDLVEVEYNINEDKKSLEENIKKHVRLQEISKVFDMYSMLDFYRHRRVDTTPTITDTPWVSSELSSVSEQESFDKYDRHYDIMDEISYTLVVGSIMNAQDSLDNERKQDLIYPSMADKRERDKIISRHNNLTSYLHASSTLDRRALALDYWSNCRTICRIEKTKTDSNSKRKNRFFHYLKSLNVMCKTESFDHLCNSLCSKEEDK